MKKMKKKDLHGEVILLIQTKKKTRKHYNSKNKIFFLQHLFISEIKKICIYFHKLNLKQKKKHLKLINAN